MAGGGSGPAAEPPASKVRVASGASRIRRLKLDPAYEEDVFDVAQGKREAELANMRLGSKGIGADDPRRQSLESFFADPSHQKGSRARPARLTGGGAAAAKASSRGQPTAPLPDVLVVGPDASARPKEQADAEHRIAEIAAAAVAKAPSASGHVAALKTRALADLAAIGRSKLAKKNRSIGTDDDMASLAQRAEAIVARFRVDVESKASTEAWNTTVQERNDFLASRPNSAMATKALERAGSSVGFAGQIYDLVYAPLAFAEASIARVTALTAERRLVDLAPTFPAPAWPAFVQAATAVDGRLAFALDKGAELAAAAVPAAALRVWFANPAKLASVADAQTILALALVGNDPVLGAKAARLVGAPMIPDVATLTATAAGGAFASIDEISKLAPLGGDLVSSKQMRALAAPPRDEHITAFNQRAGATATQVAAEWTHLTATVADVEDQATLVRVFALAPEAGTVDLRRLVDNWANLSDRTTVEGAVVAKLVKKGLLLPKGTKYNSGTWGHGGVYRFELPGGGRIEAEWHIHYQSGGGKEATIAGAGWKNKAQKYGVGAKSFDGNEPDLVAAMRTKNAWMVVKF